MINQDKKWIPKIWDSAQARFVEFSSEQTGNNPQQVQALEQEVVALEVKKQEQLANSQEPDTSTKTNESNNNQIANNSAKPNTGTALIIVGGLLVISAALIIGYLLGKDKNKK